MPSNNIRLVIADDHAMVRQSLLIAIETDDHIEVIGEAENGKEAFALCQQLHPDVVLMDLSMPVMDGVTATRLIREHCPQVRVLILTSGIDPDMISAAMTAGAQGYLEKHVTIEVLTRAIHSAPA